MKGQTLITVVVFIIIAITISTGAIVLTFTNSRVTSKFALGSGAYYVAESGIENALLNLLRNPLYEGEILSVADGTATVTVASGSAYTITSEGRLGNFVRKIQVTAIYTNNILSITSWREIF